MKQHHCQKCQYEWDSIVNLPKQCPRCKRYDWFKNSKSSASKNSKDSSPPTNLGYGSSFSSNKLTKEDAEVPDDFFLKEEEQ